MKLLLTKNRCQMKSFFFPRKEDANLPITPSPVFLQSLDATAATTTSGSLKRPCEEEESDDDHQRLSKKQDNKAAKVPEKENNARSFFNFEVKNEPFKFNFPLLHPPALMLNYMQRVAFSPSPAFIQSLDAASSLLVEVNAPYPDVIPECEL